MICLVNRTEVKWYSKSFMFFSPSFSLSETIMFLHEIFHQGLKARIANWPTLVLGKQLPFSLSIQSPIAAFYHLPQQKMHSELSVQTSRTSRLLLMHSALVKHSQWRLTSCYLTVCRHTRAHNNENLTKRCLIIPALKAKISVFQSCQWKPLLVLWPWLSDYSQFFYRYISYMDLEKKSSKDNFKVHKMFFTTLKFWKLFFKNI